MGCTTRGTGSGGMSTPLAPCIFHARIPVCRSFKSRDRLGPSVRGRGPIHSDCQVRRRRHRPPPTLPQTPPPPLRRDLANTHGKIPFLQTLHDIEVLRDPSHQVYPRRPRVRGPSSLERRGCGSRTSSVARKATLSLVEPKTTGQRTRRPFPV